jgi:hypothetical protein
MLWALFNDLNHGVVKDSSLVDIILERLEGHEVPDLDLVSD